MLQLFSVAIYRERVRAPCIGMMRCNVLQEKSLASQSWDDSRLTSLDEPAARDSPDGTALHDSAARHSGNGAGRRSNGHHGDADERQNCSEEEEDERRATHAQRQSESVASLSVEDEAADEMWRAGGDAAVHDAPAASPKKTI